MDSKTIKKSKSFSSMKLNKTITRGIKFKGYKSPTPIQTKCIPLVLEGKDVLANSRTGSGKTAAFLLPILHMLGAHSLDQGARALVIAPTRELSLQIHSDMTKLGKFTDLHACLLVGGESFDEQFYALNNKPDLIICTPGRLFHILNETDFKLDCVKHVVFDEADRLFEMGFSSQLNFILSRLPAQRQTLLFSATLPPEIGEFSRAALNNPVVAKNDSDMCVSEELEIQLLYIREDEKLAALLYLMKEKIQPSGQQALVFCSTSHCAETVRFLLDCANVPSCVCYGKMDQTARKQSLSLFRTNKVCALVVTDLASRGLDIPLLDNMINFSFPPTPKLFVHRVGRVARNGRKGVSFSLVSPEETPYVVEVATHLGIEILVSKDELGEKPQSAFLGKMPSEIVESYREFAQKTIGKNTEIKSLLRSSENAEKLYIKTRPMVSKSSFKNAKKIVPCEIHPSFELDSKVNRKDEDDFKSAIRHYKSKSTIFEIGENKKTRDIMERKRRHVALMLSKNSEAILNTNSKTKVDKRDKQETNSEAQHIIPCTKSYRDDKHYIVFGKSATNAFKEKNTDKEITETLDVETFDDEITPDDIENLSKKQYKKWNMKKRKFQLVTEVDGKVLKQNKKLFNTDRENTNLQKKWKKVASAPVEKNLMDRWGGARKNRYVQRVVFEKQKTEIKKKNKKQKKHSKKIAKSHTKGKGKHHGNGKARGRGKEKGKVKVANKKKTIPQRVKKVSSNQVGKVKLNRASKKQTNQRGTRKNK